LPCLPNKILIFVYSFAAGLLDVFGMEEVRSGKKR